MGFPPAPQPPIGSLMMHYSATPPSGWLFCDGSVYQPAVYPKLFLILGLNVLPDFRDRKVMGVATYSLGQTGGQLHHTHGAGMHGHTVAAQTDKSGGPSGPNQIGISLLGLGTAASVTHTHQVTVGPASTTSDSGFTDPQDAPFHAVYIMIRAV